MNKQNDDQKQLNTIEKYKIKLKNLNENCMKLTNETELIELFKGVVIMFIKEVILLYNKLIQKIPDLKYSKSSEKITKLNILLNALESDGKLFNLDCNTIILRAYVNYIYTLYRDNMMNWNIKQIIAINTDNITKIVCSTVSKENIIAETSDYLNIIPEIVLMIQNLKDKDILKILYLLNNLNTVVDVFFYKKMLCQ